MKILIFAGGTGTRMWPLSRKSFPKQFIKMFNGKSTLELAVDRVKVFGLENIYISTNSEYVSLVKKYFPKLNTKNIVGEPEKRGLTAAIGYNLLRLKKLGHSGPVAILWADHIMKNEKNFLKVLNSAEKLLKENSERMIFIGEEPRYANNNLGYIHIGKEIKPGVNKFLGWHYKPPVDKCVKMFKSGNWVWNPGYFVFDIDFLLKQFKKYVPDVYKKVEKICDKAGEKEEKELLRKIYPTIEVSNWEKEIVEKLPSEAGAVVRANMGWSDPGTLYALKEALVKDTSKNMVEGNVSVRNTKDSLIVNKEKSKLVATIGLESVAVVNTEDVILVVPRDNILEVSELIKDLKEDPKLRKYT